MRRSTASRSLNHSIAHSLPGAEGGGVAVSHGGLHSEYSDSEAKSCNLNVTRVRLLSDAGAAWWELACVPKTRGNPFLLIIARFLHEGSTNPGWSTSQVEWCFELTTAPKENYHTDVPIDRLRRRPEGALTIIIR